MFALKPKLICFSSSFNLVEFARSGQTALLVWQNLRARLEDKYVGVDRVSRFGRGGGTLHYALNYCVNDQ